MTLIHVHGVCLMLGLMHCLTRPDLKDERKGDNQNELLYGYRKLQIIASFMYTKLRLVNVATMNTSLDAQKAH